MHEWFKVANITHTLPVPIYWQTDLTPKRVVVSSLHDTVARFRNGVKFSPWYKNGGELTPGWLAPAWHLWWYHVTKYRAMRGNQRELAPMRKSPRCHVNTPLDTCVHGFSASSFGVFQQRQWLPFCKESCHSFFNDWRQMIKRGNFSQWKSWIRKGNQQSF